MSVLRTLLNCLIKYFLYYLFKKPFPYLTGQHYVCPLNRMFFPVWELKPNTLYSALMQLPAEFRPLTQILPHVSKQLKFFKDDVSSQRKKLKALEKKSKPSVFVVYSQAEVRTTRQTDRQMNGLLYLSTTCNCKCSSV